MGGSQSTPGAVFDARAGIKVVLENTIISSGDDIRGTVGLLVYQMLEYNTLHLELFGQSQLDWEIAESRGHGRNARTRRRRISGSEAHINFKTPIFVWPDRCIPPGQYNLPFTMKVPEGLPSSIQYDKLDASVKVCYFVGASISEGIRDTADFIVHQRLGLPLYETSMLRSADVQFWCFGQGRATTSVELSSRAYFLGDTVQLTLKYDFSNCKRSAHSFHVNLRYNLRMFIPPHHYRVDAGNLATAVAKCEAKQGVIEFAMKTAEMGNKISTLLSSSINCEFFLVISPKFGCCVCAGDLSCQMMVVMSSKFPHVITVASPPNWNPVVLQPLFIQPPPQLPGVQPPGMQPPGMYPPGVQPPGVQPYSDQPSALDLSKISQEPMLRTSN
jgi:hypothetical protein